MSTTAQVSSQQDFSDVLEYGITISIYITEFVYQQLRKDLISKLDRAEKLIKDCKQYVDQCEEKIKMFTGDPKETLYKGGGISSVEEYDFLVAKCAEENKKLIVSVLKEIEMKRFEYTRRELFRNISEYLVSVLVEDVGDIFKNGQHPQVQREFSFTADQKQSQLLRIYGNMMSSLDVPAAKIAELESSRIWLDSTWSFISSNSEGNASSKIANYATGAAAFLINPLLGTSILGGKAISDFNANKKAAGLLKKFEERFLDLHQEISETKVVLEKYVDSCCGYIHNKSYEMNGVGLASICESLSSRGVDIYEFRMRLREKTLAFKKHHSDLLVSVSNNPPCP